MATPPDLNDYGEYPGMVGWFDPGVLVDAGRRAIISALFGSYADRRLIHAALDPVSDETFVERASQTASIAAGPDGAVWVDYVADLGDGFDSTYAIAYLLGRPSLAFEGVGTLPRGQLLVMGGDQVYPTATRREYDRRMLRPYAYAFPDSDVPGAVHPPIFLIPGNHDWYNGLTLFLALFCRGRAKKVGSWQAIQRRSYFAVRLPGNWWVWGFDSQLGEDIDLPQSDYFAAVARSMSEGAKVILCAPVPSWIHGEAAAKDPAKRQKFHRALDYVANIVRNESPTARICAVISGDTHHYSRYSAAEDGTQFITAGGGGAFLHPTHQLVETIYVSWMRRGRHLSLKTAPDADHAPAEKPACYPQPEESRRLLRGNLLFAATNPLFCAALGIGYWLIAQLLILGRPALFSGPAAGYGQWAWQILTGVLASPLFLAAAAGLAAILFKYADGQSAARWRRGIAHTAIHVLLIMALLSLLPPLNAALFGILPGGLAFFFLFAAEMILIGGFAGGIVWGLYLLVACWKYALHTNDAFSAMRLDSYRHFLRMRIKGDELTIYPIGLDKAPRRCEWQINPQGGASQDDAVIMPKQELHPHLIEEPIIIRP